jgi:predicted tellurium resistance membrane protein TerC
MEWIADPSIWAGLVTLVVIELVLGIDNLVFIAILAEKLPPSQRDRARNGLLLAMVMRCCCWPLSPGWSRSPTSVLHSRPEL